jgi:ABC-type multidrug transport system permease subunit
MISAMRDPLRLGASAVLVLLIMLGGSLVLWVGVPVGWLYIGSQIQGATDSIGAALGAMLVGAPLTIIVIAKGLVFLNRKHMELREARGHEVSGQGALEAVMIVSAFIAVAGFVFWFLILTGPGPSLAPQN